MGVKRGAWRADARLRGRNRTEALYGFVHGLENGLGSFLFLSQDHASDESASTSVRPGCVKGGFRCQFAVGRKVVERSQGVLKGLEALGNERQFPSLLARVKAVKKLQRVSDLFDLDAEL